MTDRSRIRLLEATFFLGGRGSQRAPAFYPGLIQVLNDDAYEEVGYDKGIDDHKADEIDPRPRL